MTDADREFNAEDEAAWQALLQRCTDDLSRIAADANEPAAVSAMLMAALRAYENSNGTEAMIELLEGLAEAARSNRFANVGADATAQ